MGTELIAFDRRGLSVSEVFSDVTQLTSLLLVSNNSTRNTFDFHIEGSSGSIVETISIGTSVSLRPEVILSGKVRGLNRSGSFDIFGGGTVRTMGIWGYRIDVGR